MRVRADLRPSFERLWNLPPPHYGDQFEDGEINATKGAMESIVDNSMARLLDMSSLNVSNFGDFNP